MFSFGLVAVKKKYEKNLKKVLDNRGKMCHNQSTFQGGEGIENLPNVLFLRVSNVWAEFHIDSGRFF